LLIKALYDCAGTWPTLEECLKIREPQTGKLTNELRVKTHVIADDMRALEEIVLNKSITNAKSNFIQNFEYFKEKINEWRKDRAAKEFDNLISVILNQIVILPINCETTDDALVIFETINNRGKPLDDSDILKAKLYGTAKDKEQFMKEWNNLKDHEEIFRVFMHILRAQADDKNKEIGLRKFFDSEGVRERFRDCEKVMQTLKIIHKIATEFDGGDEVFCLWRIMNTYPNRYWNYPLYVFLHKHGKLNVRDEFELQDRRLNEFKVLLKETVKYYFFKGVAGRGGANDVKEAVYKVYSKIESNGDYLQEYKSDIKPIDEIEFSVRLEANRVGRFSKGLVLIGAYLNPRQNIENFAKLLSEKYDIEHILPHS